MFILYSTEMTIIKYFLCRIDRRQSLSKTGLDINKDVHSYLDTGYIYEGLDIVLSNVVFQWGFNISRPSKHWLNSVSRNSNDELFYGNKY